MIDLHASPPDPPQAPRSDRAWKVAGGLLLVVLVALAAGLVAIVVLA